MQMSAGQGSLDEGLRPAWFGRDERLETIKASIDWDAVGAASERRARSRRGPSGVPHGSDGACASAAALYRCERRGDGEVAAQRRLVSELHGPGYGAAPSGRLDDLPLPQPSGGSRPDGRGVRGDRLAAHGPRAGAQEGIDSRFDDGADGGPGPPGRQMARDLEKPRTAGLRPGGRAPAGGDRSASRRRTAAPRWCAGRRSRGATAATSPPDWR